MKSGAASKSQPKKGAEGSAGSSAPHPDIAAGVTIREAWPHEADALFDAELGVQMLQDCEPDYGTTSWPVEEISVAVPAAAGSASLKAASEFGEASGSLSNDAVAKLETAWGEALSGPAPRAPASILRTSRPWPPWQSLRTEGLWWFRIFGFGLWAASYRLHPPPFSERNGGNGALPLGRWRVRLLWPGDLA